MNLILYLLFINALTYGMYWADKRAARRGDSRIPEVALLLVGFLGGTVAAVAAQQIVRHKNKKMRFQLAFWTVTGLQLYCLFNPPLILQKIFAHLLT